MKVDKHQLSEKSVGRSKSVITR